jgi:hypothetical protein
VIPGFDRAGWRNVFLLEEVTQMKKALILLSLGFIFAIPSPAQERSNITVVEAQSVTGVVLIVGHVIIPDAGQKGIVDLNRKVSIQLQCNKEMSGCVAPKPGNYLLVRLPKNRGMYECANARLYASTADPDTSQPIGEYCLTEK